jgi:hypothetical protein
MRNVVFDGSLLLVTTEQNEAAAGERGGHS